MYTLAPSGDVNLCWYCTNSPLILYWWYVGIVLVGYAHCIGGEAHEIECHLVYTFVYGISGYLCQPIIVDIFISRGS